MQEDVAIRVYGKCVSICPKLWKRGNSVREIDSSYKTVLLGSRLYVWIIWQSNVYGYKSNMSMYNWLSKQVLVDLHVILVCMSYLVSRRECLDFIQCNVHSHYSEDQLILSRHCQEENEIFKTPLGVTVTLHSAQSGCCSLHALNVINQPIGQSEIFLEQHWLSNELICLIHKRTCWRQYTMLTKWP